MLGTKKNSLKGNWYFKTFKDWLKLKLFKKKTVDQYKFQKNNLKMHKKAKSPKLKIQNEALFHD